MDDGELLDQYRAAERMAGVGVWRWEPKSDELWWSPGMHEIFGIPPERFDRRQSTFFDAVLPEDRRGLVEAAARFDETGRTELLRYRIRRPNGEIRHLWASGETCHDEDGSVLFARGIVLDITERMAVETELREARREQEARFESLVVNAPLPLMVFAEDGEVLTVNRRWTELTGYTHADLPTIAAWTALSYGERADEVRELIGELFGREGPVAEGDFEVRARDGRTMFWEFCSAPLGRLPDGRRLMVSMATDQTWRREAEDQRRAYERRMHHAQKLESLGVFASGLTHDFNNILVGVLGNLALVLDELPDDDPKRAMLDDARDAAERAASLSRQILTYVGKHDTRPERVDVNAGLRANLGLLRSMISRRVELELELGEELAPIRVESGQLFQLLMNLVTNAAESYAGGSGRVTIRTGREHCSAEQLAESVLGEERPAGEYVYLEVEDRGEGMSAETVARLFEPFFTRKFAGRGLGMAVVLGILRAHGGVAEVDSAPGRGTRIRVRFLACDLPVPERVEAEPATPSRSILPASRVLLVDDEAIVRRSVERMLARLGLTVLVAKDGEQALELHARHADEIGLVVLDLTLPGISGVEVLRELNARAPALPVILATGYSSEALRRELDALDFASLLDKPFGLAELREEIEAALYS